MTAIYVKNGTPTDAQSKCASCMHAHILRGFRESEELVYCNVTYGPALVVPFKVYECSSYLDRTRPTWKQMEELAIDILPLTSSKPAGFCSQRDSNLEGEDVEKPEPETVNC